MKNKKIVQGLSGLLCAALLSQSLVSTAGAWWNPWDNYTYQEPETVTVEESVVPLAETPAVTPVLQSNTAVIPLGTSVDVVNQILAETLISNYNELTPEQIAGLEWEYRCKGEISTGGVWDNESWGAISGFQTSKKIVFVTAKYIHPPLADNTRDNGVFQVRLAGMSDNGVTLTKLTEAPKKEASITLKDGPYSIPMRYTAEGSIDYAAAGQAILAAVVAGTDPAGVSVTVEYDAKNVSVDIGSWGDPSWKPLSHTPGTLDNTKAFGEGTWTIRFSFPDTNEYNGTFVTATVEMTGRQTAPISFQENAAVGLTYNEDLTVNYEALEEAVRALFTAEGIDLSGAALEYYATAKSGSVGSVGKNWAPLAGGKVSGLEYPAMGAGAQQVRLVWDGNNQYAPATVSGTITVTDREAAAITFTPAEAKLAYVQNEDGSISVSNLDALVETVRGMFSCEDTTVDLSNAAVEYYATPSVDIAGSGQYAQAWGSLEGFTNKIVGVPVNYPAISEGAWQVRLVWGGNTQYAPTTVEGTVTVTGREAIQYTLKDAPYEAGMVFTAGQGYDYAATIRAIYDAVVASTEPAVDYEAVKMEYTTTADVGGVNFKPLDHQGATGLLDFKEGAWKIRITWPETVDYRAASATVEVKVTDNRIPSEIKLKEGASFTYNMDYAVMERAVFDNVIDWENSTLPEGADLSAFDIKYKAQLDVLDDSFDAGKLTGILDKIPGLGNAGGTIDNIASSLGESTKVWMPIEGGKNAVGVPYAPMGAGEHKVQITFKGSAEYKPSEAAEGSVTVKKANVKVKVNSTNIRAGKDLPANFITTDPADKFEFYTIYAGATSNVNLGLYLDLPAKYTGSKLLKILDPVVERIAGKSFTAMLNEGVTLGELRKMFTNTELIDLLEKVGVDTGAFGQIIKVVNALPSITDSVRVGFGVPKNQAGLYTVTVITDNKNYNTGVGVGALLVRMNLKGVKLTWNQDLGKQISAADAKAFDFGATLSFDGDVSISQSSVHYLYSGFTSKWKPYSSTTKAPTEPGRYTMTVVTLGGSYQAAPITRSFQITK